MIATAAMASTFYARTNLTSDVPGLAAFTDTNLAGAWGVTHSSTSPWWVNSTAGGVSLVLSGAGQPFPTNGPLVVAIPPVPSEASGIVFNGGGGFNVASNVSAIFIFVTLNGTVSGWSPGQANRSLAVLKVTGGGVASYTGVTIASWGGTNRLYVANYGENRVDVFDQSFNPVTLSSNAFTDADVPAGLKVFNVQLISSNLLFVTYAPTNVFGNSTVPGAGYVAVYAANGILLGHLRHGQWMNAPWGVVSAPDRDGDTVFVGMFGDGTIATFDGERGHFRGLLRDEEGRPVTIGKGLWGLGFGNGAGAGPTNELYFAADMVTTNGFHGIFGALTPVARDHDEDDKDMDEQGGGDDHGRGDDRGQRGD
jgi:uncharacterized protein (TIGR03118 family)